MAELAFQIRCEFRPWAKKLLVIASRMPLLFVWIGAERLARLIASRGVLVHVDIQPRSRS